VAEEQYGEAGVFGLVQVFFGAGTLAGSLAGIRWRPERPMRTALAAAVLWPPSFVVFALGTPVAGLCAVTFVGGTGVGLFGVWWETALAERIPPHLLSRVSAYDWMGSLALLPLGYVLSGIIGEAVGASQTLLIGGAISAVALGMGLLPRETRTLPRFAMATPMVAGTPPPVVAVAPDRQ
jgi:hypothetical protein